MSVSSSPVLPREGARVLTSIGGDRFAFAARHPITDPIAFMDETHGQRGARAVYEPSEGGIVSGFAPSHRSSVLSFADFDHWADL